MKILSSLMVLFMTILGFAQVDNWESFNSSLLIEVTRPHGVFTCTGVAISNQTLITAAHCLDGEIKGVRIFSQSSYNPKNSFLAIKEYAIHPQYNSKKSRFLSDVAKITMKEKFSDSIKICPIHKGNQIFGKLYRFGFGERNKKNIRTVITPTLRRINPDDNILELNDQYSMSGDSGGPIFLKNGSTITILAIHSTFSHGPEGNYSLNPLLESYSPWLFSH